MHVQSKGFLQYPGKTVLLNQGITMIKGIPGSIHSNMLLRWESGCKKRLTAKSQIDANQSEKKTCILHSQRSLDSRTPHCWASSAKGAATRTAQVQAKYAQTWLLKRGDIPPQLETNNLIVCYFGCLLVSVCGFVLHQVALVLLGLPTRINTCAFVLSICMFASVCV